MVCWSHIIIEAYCAREWSNKKDKFVFEAIDLKKANFKKKKNSHFDPKYKVPKKPSFCPNSPSYICLEKNCSYLAYTNAENEDYKTLFKKYERPKKQINTNNPNWA